MTGHRSGNCDNGDEAVCDHKKGSGMSEARICRRGPSTFQAHSAAMNVVSTHAPVTQALKKDLPKL